MINLLVLTEQGLNANTAVELRKAGAELGIKGASKGKKADLIAAIMVLVEAAKKAEAEKAKPAKRGVCTECGRKEDFRGSGLCEADREYAESENAHSDEDHDGPVPAGGDFREQCQVCHPELDRRTPRGTGRSRAGMVIVAKGTEIHKSNTFKVAAEAAGWTVAIMGTVMDDEETERYVAYATKGDDRMELAWNGRAYDYPASSALLKGKGRKVRNLKEALRLL